MEAGFYFISFQRSTNQFASVQLNLAKHCALNAYIRLVDSALLAIPGGISDESYVGAALFA